MEATSTSLAWPEGPFEADDADARIAFFHLQVDPDELQITKKELAGHMNAAAFLSPPVLRSPLRICGPAPLVPPRDALEA